MEFDTIVFVIAFDKPDYTSKVMDCFIASKNISNTKLVLVDNSDFECLVDKYYFKRPDVVHFKTQFKNKSKALNQAVKAFCKQNNDFIISLDNDVEFDQFFLKKYIDSAKLKGLKYYFGTSFIVKNKPKIINQSTYRFLQGSQKGKTDQDFKKNKMFLGFSYAFFKKQWLQVGGFDERFGPGSSMGLSGDESIFQKKLIFAGFKPFLIESNPIVHKPLNSSYRKERVLKRVKQNGLTHGFQKIIESKPEYFKRLLGLLWINCKLLIMFKFYDLHVQLKYLSGYLNSLIIYIKIEDKSSIYQNIKKL
ncbi:glycosyltransferase family 2 protein [Psychroflexus halocasei]|nr:glycosyltransferase [Psychroflexus halocasei]